ncbi:hypothetical protein RRG08_011189 [Elysia crispata]|uniref:MRH domain-containing protein n=1 Tax=Elysia crispata TaxID=231223 RepID=A0AAE0YCY8_9GAST|nr:hypothetical protein RRG08_011189 [Elysia crispata]
MAAFVALLWSDWPGCYAQNCVGEGPCRCVMSDGTGTVDISSLGNQDGTARFPEEFSYDGSAYSFNPCFPISKGGSCKKSAVCQKQSEESYTDMGQQDSAVWAFTGYYSQITYTATSGRQTEVLLICDPAYVNPQLTVIGELEPNKLSLNLWTNCACPNTCERVDPITRGSSALTAGSVLLIIFFAHCLFTLWSGSFTTIKRTKRQGKSSCLTTRSGRHCLDWSRKGLALLRISYAERKQVMKKFESNHSECKSSCWCC